MVTSSCSCIEVEVGNAFFEGSDSKEDSFDFIDRLMDATAEENDSDEFEVGIYEPGDYYIPPGV